MKQKIAFALIMGIITTGIISFTLISVNIGYTERFLSIWLRSWGMAYLVVIPAILAIGPLVQRLVTRLFPEKQAAEEEPERYTEVLTEMIEE
jgi:hypothetical protein